MRILLTANGSPWTRNRGGGTLAVHHLAEALAAQGHAVTVLYGRRPGDPVPPTLPYETEWAHFYQVATLNLNIFSFRKKLARLIRSQKFDVVHGNAEEALFAPALCRKAGVPFCYTSHANYLPPVGILRGMLRPIPFLKSVNAYLERETARQADLVFTFSRFSEGLVARALGREVAGRIRVIRPGIDPRWRFLGETADIKKQILFWGRMAEQKGVDLLLRSFQRVRERIKDATLVLVGEGACRAAYEKLSETLGVGSGVQFQGWKDVEGILGLAQESAVGVFPSRIESFGLAVAEAMATGLPVVATRVGALPEIIEDGRTGRLVEPEDVDGLAECLVAILQNPLKYREWGVKAGPLVAEKHNWEHAAGETLKAYGELLSGKRGGIR